ncbi:MAG: hypothetical protein ACON4T_07710 [Synechococcus sp.]
MGDNGVGKSSVLEAFDCFFNGKEWNINTATKKSGLTTAKPYIVPIFMLKKRLLKSELECKATTLNDIALSLAEEDVPNANLRDFKRYSEIINRIKSNINLANYYILPIGMDYNGLPSLSIFNCKKLATSINGDNAEGGKLSDDELEKFKPLLENIRKSIDYIYIPREIDPELFTKLETSEIQILMGETLHESLERLVTSDKIKEINSSLNSFIENLAEELDGYAYRTPTDRQQNLKKNDVYNLIIQAFSTQENYIKKKAHTGWRLEA